MGKHTTPIYLSARFAGGLEDLAKDSRSAKDSVAIFEKSFSWNREVERIADKKGLLWCEENKEENREKAFTLEEVTEIAGYLERLLKEGKVSRALLYKFLQLHGKYVERVGEGWHIDPKIYPRLYYYITRNTEEDVRNELIDALLNGKGGSMEVRSLIINLDVALYIALMKTRKGGE